VPTNKQRREAERRRLQRQLQRRQTRAESRRRVTILTSVICVLAVVGIIVGFLLSANGNSKPAATPKPTVPATSKPPSSAAAASASCSFTKSGQAARPVKLPPAQVPAKGTVRAVVTTNQGPMTFTLDRTNAPCATASFVSLAQQKYFDKTPCHRLTTSGLYVLQCGDPTGTGRGGPGYVFATEGSNQNYTRGVLAMANTGAPDSNGSQFFIVYKKSMLSGGYTVFGSVTSGMPVVDKVAAKGVKGGGSDGAPALPVKIEKVAIRS
jgi:peptidyl-prolyl cis-trans isomerase B (cyclophilin B)